MGACAELSLALGLGLEWTGKGQKGKKRADVNAGGQVEIEAKGTESMSKWLELTPRDLDRKTERVFVLVQIHLYHDQVCCYPVGWQWRSRITERETRRTDLRDMQELLTQLERMGHGPYSETTGAKEAQPGRQ